MYKSMTLLYVLYADVGPMHPDGHPRTHVWPVQGGDGSFLRVIEGKLAMITQDVPTLWIDKIPMIMEEYVVGVLTTWICLLTRVARGILH